MNGELLRIVAGLGNPGPDYDGTRHNLGFRVIDSLAVALEISLERRLPGSVWNRGVIDQHELVLARPTLFVNRSGKSIAELMRALASVPSDLIVIHDDLDLPLGEIRLKTGGSSGGHRGVESIIEQLGTVDFDRVRLGIGRPPGRQDPAHFVLNQFTKRQLTLANEAVQRAAEAVLFVIREGMEAGMNRYNEVRS